MRARLSADDKTGLLAFAEGLAALGVDLVASGGTARLLAEGGLSVTDVEDLTGYPPLLGHRVVTLHPAVHGGILARRDVDDDAAELERHAIEPIDLVCVNLYPFERTVGRLDVTWDEAIEQIDVGGPALLRAAAKNHRFVVPICRPADYEVVLEELRETGGVGEDLRRELAERAFATTAAYDAAVAAWLAGDRLAPETLVLAFDRSRSLTYGENPHQEAAYYEQRGARTHLLARVDQLHGRPLSYNNLNDLAAARRLALELGPHPACVIVKHANPCGVAVAETIEDAYAGALACDPTSAYGGVIVVTQPVGADLGVAIAEQFVEVLHTPGVDAAALEALARKEGTRVLVDRERRSPSVGERALVRVPGGLLVQSPDEGPDPLDAMSVACGTADTELWDELLFAWTVARHVTSNAIVLASGGRTIGIGAGQMSRVDAVRIALEKARAHGHDPSGAVLASDGFFPFADGPQLALDAGVRALVQPGGSKRDAEVVAAVDAAGATMVLTGRRHFRH
ncbi:MAG: bifunctional phosphoribosylaminoimidazolecarboxamide formyltransferase/IMP cyclohydrolase [Gaiella sp.]